MRSFKKTYSAHKRGFDIPLLVAVVSLVLFGLLMVYDSSVIQAYRDFGDNYYYIRQQIIWSGIGFVALGVFAFFDYHKLLKLAVPATLISILLMIAVFIPGLGVSSGGAHRWLDLGVFTLQPAEVFKFWGVCALSAIFAKKPTFRVLLIVIVLTALVMGVFQKDLGSTIVFVLTVSIIFISAGGSFMKLLVGLPIGIIGFLILVISSEYRRKRILAFLDPFSDSQGFTYHISKVLIALGSGGFLGLGLGQSRQKFEYIPEVTTDSIFAIIGEELGFLGTVGTLLLFSLLIVRGFKIAENANDNYGKVLAVGLTSWLGIQTIINVSSMVAFLPLTGVPLPFISYGGSALVANMAAVGILLNISRRGNS